CSCEHPFFYGGEAGLDSTPSFDKERSDAGRRSEAQAPRRGEPKANQSLPISRHPNLALRAPFFYWRRGRLWFEPFVRKERSDAGRRSET
ncbi:MAG: hypothetical protein AB2704_18270, partial [Candidatus Thiodiazotropha taylori]